MADKTNTDKSSKKQYWGGEWRDRLLYLKHMSGVSRPELSEEYDLDPATIHRSLYREAARRGDESAIEDHLSPDKEARYRLYMAGISSVRIAKEFGISYQAVQYHARATAYKNGISPKDFSSLRAKAKEELRNKADEDHGGNVGAVIDEMVKSILSEYLVMPDERMQDFQDESDEVLQEFIDILGEDVVLGSDGFDKDAMLDKLRGKIGGTSRDIVRLALEFLNAYIDEEQYKKRQASNGSM